jgi:RNA polymerase sigma factor (TIGR02999 family)
VAGRKLLTTKEVSVTAPSPRDITELLVAWNGGDRAAFDALVPRVYDELHRLARRALRRERQGHSLQTTALVNEAYIRLIDTSRVRWQDRAHFFAMSAEIMRRILVDFARAQKRVKRGGEQCRVTLDEGIAVAGERDVDLVALDEALTRLGSDDPRKGRVVELRYFGGLSVEETAEVLGVSVETVMRDWKLAKVWLVRELSRGSGG